MKSIAEKLRPFYIKGIFNVDERIRFSLHDWLKAKREWEINAFSANGFELSVFEESKLVQAFVGDCSNLCTSSFESICGISKDSNGSKAIAWALIRAYYSAFFAASSIIRIFGVSCSYFEREHISRLNERVSAIDQTMSGITIKPGSYKCVFDRDESKLICTEIETTGGAHEALWKVFGERIRELGVQVLENQTLDIERQSFVAKLTELDRNLKLNGRNGGNWLSYIRNQINYRSGYGAWFPYKNGLKNPELVFKLMKTWSKDPMNIELDSYSEGQEVQRFLSCCIFIVGLCNDLITDITENCEVNQHHFKRYGPGAYLNLSKN